MSNPNKPRSEIDGQVGMNEWFRRWQKGQMEEYNGLSNSDKAHFLEKVKHNFDLADERFGVQLKETEAAAAELERRDLEAANNNKVTPIYDKYGNIVGKVRVAEKDEVKQDKIDDGIRTSEAGDEAANAKNKLKTPDEYLAELEAARDKYFAELDSRVEKIKKSYQDRFDQLYADYAKKYGDIMGSINEKNTDKESGNDEDDTSKKADTSLTESDFKAEEFTQENGEESEPDFELSKKRYDEQKEKFDNALNASGMKSRGAEDVALEILDDFFSGDNMNEGESEDAEENEKTYPDSVEYVKNIQFKDGDNLEPYLLEIKKLYIDNGEDSDITNRAYSLLKDRFNESKKTVRLFSEKEFSESPDGLRAMFEYGPGFSYASTIRRLKQPDLEGKTFGSTSGALKEVLGANGRSDDADKFVKMLKKKYESLGINDDGTVDEERSKKQSWIKRAGASIKKTLKINDGE